MTRRILFIGRGMPSGGHVSTCFSIGNELKKRHACEILFVSYGPGTTLLKFLGADFIDLPHPASSALTHRTFPGWDLFELHDYLTPIVENFRPDAVVCDGELYVPLFCEMLNIPCVSIASPNYISLDYPPYSDYAVWIARQLNHSTLILGYAAKEIQPSALLDSTRLVMLPPLMKYDKNQLSRPAARARRGYDEDDLIVLVYKGAGNVQTPEFLTEVNKIATVPVHAYLHSLQHDYPRMKLILVSGTAVDIPQHPNIRFESYLDFMEMAHASDLVIARAGRNVMYEMAYLGVPSILVGIDSKTDLQRNCEIAEQWHIARTIHSENLTPATLGDMVRDVLAPAAVQKFMHSGQSFVPENGTPLAADKIIHLLHSDHRIN